MGKALSRQDWQVRTAAYRHTIDNFVAPATDDLVDRLELPAADIEASLVRLDGGHQIVLAPGETRVWMLHPFSAVPTEFPVEVDGGTYWGNCAWDAGRADAEWRGRPVEASQAILGSLGLEGDFWTL